MNYSGIVTCELRDGSTRCFKFGMAASAKFCKMQNIKWSELDQALTDLNPQTLINAYHSAALAYDEFHKNEIDYDDNDVADWIDQIGVDVLSMKLLEALIPPKSSLPEPPKKKALKKPSRSFEMSSH